MGQDRHADAPKARSLLPPKVPKRPPVAKAKEAEKEASVQTGKVVTQTCTGLRESTDGVEEYSVVDARLEDDNDAWGVVQTENIRKAVPRYYDQAQGLSWQERLERLDFSDDEEEDDSDAIQAQEDLPAKSGPNQADATSPSCGVAVEYCQPFTADLS